MRKLLLNPTPLYRKLRQLSLLLTLLLTPIGAWAEDYPILVGNTRLTSENIGNYPIKWNNDPSMPTITLTNADLTETITWDGHISTYGGQLLIVLEGANKISTTDQFCLIEKRDITESGNGYDLTFVAADDDSELTMECNKIDGDVRTIDGFYNMTDPQLLDLHQTLTSTSEKYTMKLVRYYGIIVAGLPITKDNVSSKITGDDISGNVSFDKDNDILTLDGATLTSGICWDKGSSGNISNLKIRLKGNNSISITGDGACIYSTALEDLSFARSSHASTRGIAYYSSISFEKDPSSSDPCSLLLSNEGGIDVINDFANSTNPTMGTGLYWFPTTDGNDNIISATIKTLLSGGEGTEESPLLIKTYDDLKDFSSYVNDGTLNTEYIKLDADIDCDGKTGLVPIGNGNRPFYGIFDGSGKNISNLSMTNVDEEYVGLFGSNSGRIENLILSGCTISGGNSSSSSIGAIVGENNGVISECTVKNTNVSCMANSQGPSVGGIAGLTNNAISECIVENTNVNAITGDTGASSANAQAGGIVGKYVSGMVSGCDVKGTTTVTADYSNMSAYVYAGAVIGENSGGTNYTTNTYESTVVTKTKKQGDTDYTVKSGQTQRGIGNVGDEIGNVELAGTKTVTITVGALNGEFVPQEDSYYMYDDGIIYALPENDVTIDMYPIEGYRPLLVLSDNSITVNSEDEMSDGLYCNHTTFTFTMPNADLTATLTFPIDLAADGITATIDNADYTGEAIEPTTVKAEGIPGATGITNLTKDTDFTIEGYTLNDVAADPINPGTYKVTIIGKGNYIGTKVIEYKINKVYDLKINGTQVKDINAADVLNDKKVVFTPATDTEPNTLTLSGAAIGGTIESGLDNLTIEIKGVNSMEYLTSTNNTASLTFKKGADNSSLSFANTIGKPAIAGFASVAYDGTYYNSNGSSKYVAGDVREFRSLGGLAQQDLTITTDVYYPLWVTDTQVSAENQDNVLSDEGATVKFNGDKTLTLNGADILSSSAIECDLKDLVINLNGSNSLSTYYDGVYPILSGDGTGTLTIAKDDNAIGIVSLSLQTTGKNAVINGFSSIEKTDLNFASKTGTAINDAATTDATLSSAKLYPLWIGGEIVSEGHTSFAGTSGTITYNESGTEKTLTLNGYQGSFATGNAIETRIVGLKVELVGTNTITCGADGAFVFKGLQEDASIQFVKGENGKLTMTTNGTTSPFNGFGDGKVTYDGLICFQSGDNEWTIKQPAKPVLSWRVDDTDHYTYATLSNADEAEFYTASPKYSFVYADEQQEVKNQVFPEDGIKMTGPGVLTAWVEVDGIKSEEVTGVRFGLTESPVTTVYEGTAKTISLDLQPEDKLTGFTVTLDSKPEFVSFDSEKKELTVNACGKGEFSLKFTNTAAVAAPEFVVLGDTAKYQIEVIPAKPIISLASGEYDETKTVALSSTVNGASIKFYLGDTAPETPQTYTAPINITKSTKLTAWVVSNDMKSQTETATYTIYQIFVNPYKDSQIWACFFSTEDDMTLPDNLEAYFITDIGETALSITQLDYLPKKVPVLIKKTGDLTGAKYTEYTGNPSTVSFENIILKYATDPIGATGKQYVLFNNEFVKATGSIPAGRCYIELDSNSGNVHARSLSIGDGETTRIVSMDIMENEAGAQWYDLQGRRIQKPAKSGLYIVKGKLVMYNNK